MAGEGDHHLGQDARHDHLRAFVALRGDPDGVGERVDTLTVAMIAAPTGKPRALGGRSDHADIGRVIALERLRGEQDLERVIVGEEDEAAGRQWG